MDKKVLAQLKEKHGAIYSLEVGGTNFIFRKLNLGEQQLVEADILTPEQEDYILKNAVVWPEPIPELRTGEYVGLLATIIQSSGWSEDDAFLAILEEKRKTAASRFSEAKSLICQYFNLKPADVDGMDIEEFLKFVAEVEVVAGKKIYSNKRDRTLDKLGSRRVSSPSVNQAQGPHEQQIASGMNSAEDSLARAIQGETGNVPVHIADALNKKGERPAENLGEKQKHFDWKSDQSSINQFGKSDISVSAQDKIKFNLENVR